MPGRCAASATRMVHDLDHARRLKGKHLRALMHDQYYFMNEKSLEDTGSLEWRCSEQPTVTMYLLSDGESVGADLFPLEMPASFELEPGVNCSWQMENLLEDLSATHLEGRLITEVEGLFDTAQDTAGCLTGFKVTFETGDYLIFFNQGDESAVLINQPLADIDLKSQWVTSCRPPIGQIIKLLQ